MQCDLLQSNHAENRVAWFVHPLVLQDIYQQGMNATHRIAGLAINMGH